MVNPDCQLGSGVNYEINLWAHLCQTFLTLLFNSRKTRPKHGCPPLSLLVLVKVVGGKWLYSASLPWRLDGGSPALFLWPLLHFLADISFFRLPMWTEDQQLSRNPPAPQDCCGSLVTSSLVEQQWLLRLASI